MAHLVPFDIKPKRRRPNEQRKTISHFKYSRWKDHRRRRRAECEEEEKRKKSHLVMSTRNKTNIKLKPTLHIGKLESIPWQAVRPPLTFSCAIFLDFICTVWRNYSHSSRKRKSFQHHFVVRIRWKRNECVPTADECANFVSFLKTQVLVGSFASAWNGIHLVRSQNTLL